MSRASPGGKTCCANWATSFSRRHHIGGIQSRAMNFSDSDARTLECHPDSRHDAVTAPICARAGWKTGALELSYGVKGDLAALRIPAPVPSRRMDDLWQHTC